MRSHEKHIDRVPDTGEVLAIIDERAELIQAEKTRDEIQQILAL